MAVYDVDTDGGGSYSSMDSAVSALPATFSSDNDITCTGATEDSTRVDFTGFDVNGNNLFVYPAAGDEHNLTWDTNLYHIGSTQSFQGILTISVDGVDITGIQVRNGTANSNGSGIRVNSGVIDVRIYGCVIYADHQNYAGRGIDIGSVAAGGNCNIVNNVVFGNWEYGVWGSWGFSARDIQIYNNTIQDVLTTGILLVGPNDTTVFNIKNNIVEGSGASDYSITGTYTLNSNTNLSSDSTSPDGASYYSSAVTFAGTGDWKLSSSDTDAKDTGTTLSADTYYAFSVDALGTTRPSGSAWDIGAHELVQAGGSVGASAGSSTVAGVGASIFTGIGSSAGTSTASGVGASTVTGVGSATGTSVVSGVGGSLASAVASSAGTSTVNGVGKSVAPGNAVASSAGTSIVTGVGASFASAVGQSAGTSTANGVNVSTSVVTAVGSASGSSTVIGIASVPETARAPGGGGKGARRRHRQFVNIDGRLIEVANRKEAEKLLHSFRNGIEKKQVKSKRITFKRGPYVSVYSVEEIKPKEVRASLAKYYDDEESLLLMLLLAA